MATKKPPPIEIKPSKVGSLRAIASREGALKKDGQINKTWARKKLASPKTTPAVKKKINFFLNFSQ